MILKRALPWMLVALLSACMGYAAAPQVDPLCRGETPPARRIQLLEQVLRPYLKGRSVAEVLAAWERRTPDCTHLVPIVGQPPGLLLQVLGKESILAWRNGDWQTVPVTFPVSRGPVYVMTGSATFPQGAPDLLLAVTGGGSGGFGAFYHATPAPTGGLEGRAITSEPIARFQADFLEPQLVLLTYQGEESSRLPLAWTCGSCFPVNDQVLYRWHPTEERLEVVGRRFFTEPGVSANRFLGALQAGDDQQAAPWATTPGVVAQAKQVLGLPAPGEISPWGAVVPFSKEVFALRERERRNWQLLPPQYRRSLPAEMHRFDVPIARGKERAFLSMERTRQGWRVASVKKQRSRAR